MGSAGIVRPHLLPDAALLGIKRFPDFLTTLHQRFDRFLPDLVVIGFLVSYRRESFIELAIDLSDLLALCFIQFKLALPKERIIKYVPLRILTLLSTGYNGCTE